jgi:ribonuclease HI
LIEAEFVKGPRVFVDAKIVGRHEREAPQRTIIAYVVEGRDELKNATKVKADETDDAELHAIAFAIQELKNKLAEFRVICDNEYVLSVIIKENQKTARKRPILSQLLAEKRENPGGQVELLENNPAHKFLSKWLAEHPAL